MATPHFRERFAWGSFVVTSSAGQAGIVSEQKIGGGNKVQRSRGTLASSSKGVKIHGLGLRHNLIAVLMQKMGRPQKRAHFVTKDEQEHWVTVASRRPTHPRVLELTNKNGLSVVVD